MYDSKKVFALLPIDGDSKLMRKAISFTGFKANTELAEFCFIIKDSIYYNLIRNEFKYFPISDLLKNYKLYYDLISDNKVNDSSIINNIHNLNIIVKCCGRAIRSNQLFYSISSSIVDAYGYGNINTYLQNYSYFLYQEDSPIIDATFNQFLSYAREEKISVPSEYYSYFLTKIDTDLKVEYKRLVEQYNSYYDRCANNHINSMELDNNNYVLLSKKRFAQYKKR